MRFGVLVVVFGLVVILLFGCANPKTETDARLDKTIETLLDAISTRDDGAILSLAANPPNFGERDRLEDDVAGFYTMATSFEHIIPMHDRSWRSWRSAPC